MAMTQNLKLKIHVDCLVNILQRTIIYPFSSVLVCKASMASALNLSAFIAIDYQIWPPGGGVLCDDNKKFEGNIGPVFPGTPLNVSV